MPDSVGEGLQDVSAQVLAARTGREGVAKPRNLVTAISEVQQYYVMEDGGEGLPADFLTMEQRLALFEVGFRSGFVEGLLVLVLPLLEFYLFERAMESTDWSVRIFFWSAPYLSVLVNTGICSYLSRFLIGNMTRRAITALLTGRTLALVVKSGLIYFCYLLLDRLVVPHRVWGLVRHFGSFAGPAYYRIMQVKPYLVPTATNSASILLAGAVLPFLVVFLRDGWRRYRTAANERLISGD